MNKKTAFIAVTATVLMGLGMGAMAEDKDGTWGKHHPRHDQVNDRLAHQNVRIHREVKEGELTHAQAASLHQDDRKIRQEERDMASQNGGHITRAEEGVLNQQDNAVSRQIGK